MFRILEAEEGNVGKSKKLYQAGGWQDGEGKEKIWLPELIVKYTQVNMYSVEYCFGCKGKGEGKWFELIYWSRNRKKGTH